MGKPRFFPSESIRRAELAVTDAIANICAENSLGYQLVPSEADGNRVAFRLEFYPDPSLPFEQLQMRRTYHWLCRAHDLPYDLPGRWFQRGNVNYQFSGATIEAPESNPGGRFVAIDPAKNETVRLTADEVRDEVIPRGKGAAGNLHFSLGLDSFLTGSSRVPVKK